MLKRTRQDPSFYARGCEEILLIDCGKTFGGGQTYCINFLEALDIEYKTKVTIITSCQMLCRRLNEIGRYDVLLCQSGIGGICAALKRLMGARERCLVIMNGSKEMMIGLFSVILSERVRFVTIRHQSMTLKGKRTDLNIVWFYCLCALTRPKVLFVSEATYRECKLNRSRYGNNIVRLLVPSGFGKPQRCLNITKKSGAQYRVTMLCRLDPEKGIYEFLDLTRGRTGHSFVLGGDGSPQMKQKINSLIESEDCALEYLGYISDVRKHLMSCHVYVSLSHSEGGIPLSIVEAIYSGLIIIASDIPQHRELLGDEYPFLVDISRRDKAVSAVEEFLESMLTYDTQSLHDLLLERIKELSGK